METAAKDVAELQQAGVERAVHKVQSGAAPAVVCFRCGGNHVAADCRFVDAVCHNCHKRGHLARKCRSARQPRRDRAYEYTLEYKEGSKHGNADALSRLPLPTMPVDTPREGEVVMLMEHMNGTPLQVKQIREWTRRDRVLSRVHQCLLQAEKLRGIFATHGIPAVLVSDNGPSLVSAEFEHFLKKNGIKHVTTAPYHPSSNGCAERAVRVFKEGIKKMGEGSVETKLSRFLFKYRSTPQTTTGATPAELLMNRRIRTQLDLVRPSLAGKVGLNQAKQKEHHDKHARDRTFTEADSVYVRGYAGQKWIPATLIERTGPVSWRVKTQDGKLVRRHQDQIRPRYDWTQTESNLQEESFPVDPTPPEPENPERPDQAPEAVVPVPPEPGPDRDNPYPE
ncbi:hypothetical protein AAFF_G00184450 [Aldrovandia affinis]|uniref:Integrase catalytic domain-containing protein n=1 Tax=Aldrovandia affinis TaxID=143900 RepID=A0AAD7RJP0_9TELE|nr:hypothetical protein AAFF_G00184450 [Aldrovandia affinis]